MHVGGENLSDIDDIGRREQEGGDGRKGLSPATVGSVTNHTWITELYVGWTCSCDASLTASARRTRSTTASWTPVMTRAAKRRRKRRDTVVTVPSTTQ